MALFSFFNREEFPHVEFNEISVGALEIDLATGRVGASMIGLPPAESDSFAGSIRRNCDISDEANGIELNAKDGKLECAFVTLAAFTGSFLKHGEELKLSASSTPSDVERLFGAPYWVDEDDCEKILFYEWNSGRFEVQFEFPDGRALEFVTLVSPGVLAMEEKRKSYGCEKPWPPTEE